MASKEKILNELLKKKWYAQGCPMSPLLIGSAAESGFFMKKYLGFGYSRFLFNFKEDYGNMNYLDEDLKRLGKIIVKKLEKDRNYFVKVDRLYCRQVKGSEGLYRNIEKTDLSRINDKELIGLAKKCCDALKISVGLGHIIEPYALTTDLEIKDELNRYVPEKDLNGIFTKLMAPVKKSFVNEQEEHLLKISKERDQKKKLKLVNEHIKRFFWIRNGYAGRKVMSKDDVLSDADTIKKKEMDFGRILKEKNDIIRRFRLDKRLVAKIRVTEYLTHWQDKRKINILVAIDYAERVFEVIAERFSLEIRLLRYTAPEEMDIRNLRSKEFAKELESRHNGGIYLWKSRGSIIISGDEYGKFMSKFQKVGQEEVKQLNGMTASAGNAIGRVKICTTLDSIEKFEEGFILVASMTRPEYVPAMKKAVAIITDEGGITCHAAIVSRELGIPCIIGTKVATKALKDGDLVEIKGNHGLVIVLERAGGGKNEK